MSDRPSQRFPVQVERAASASPPAKRAGHATRTSTRLKAELAAREQDVAYRLAALKQEVASPFGGLTSGARPLMSTAKANPERLLVLAGIAGATAGLLLGLRSRRKRRPQPDAGTDFIQARLSTFLDDAASKVAKGRRTQDALDDLFRTVPVIYSDRQFEASTNQTSVAKTLAKSAMGFGLKVGMDMLTQALTGRNETFSAIADAQE